MPRLCSLCGPGEETWSEVRGKFFYGSTLQAHTRDDVSSSSRPGGQANAQQESHTSWWASALPVEHWDVCWDRNPRCWLQYPHAPRTSCRIRVRVHWVSPPTLTVLIRLCEGSEGHVRSGAGAEWCCQRRCARVLRAEVGTGSGHSQRRAASAKWAAAPHRASSVCNLKGVSLLVGDELWVGVWGDRCDTVRQQAWQAVSYHHATELA